MVLILNNYSHCGLGGFVLQAVDVRVEGLFCIGIVG